MSRYAHFSVQFVLDRMTVSTVVMVPYHEDESYYDKDDSAEDMAKEFLLAEYGINIDDYKVVDVEVECEAFS